VKKDPEALDRLVKAESVGVLCLQVQTAGERWWRWLPL